MLHLLPTEIALHTISCLPLQSLYSVGLVSRAWNDLVTINAPAVYRNAAMLHRFVDGDQLCAGSIPDDWKIYCRRQLEIERGWRGKAPSITRELTATGNVVHRIKVDYELGLVITTYQIAALSVCDIKNNRVLWALPSSHVVQYAHCEYDRGYIVINRYDNCKEVWRRTIDAEGEQPPEVSPPDKKMLDASAQAAFKFSSVEDRWGHFQAWALLRMPDHTRAFRFSYPTLLASSSNNAYVWDVPTSRLVSVIEDIQRPYHGQQLVSMSYVEVNDLYALICGENVLRIFAREGGALLYQLSSRELSSASWNVLPQARGLPSSIVHPKLLLPNDSPSSFHGHFVACHVSASGNDLAILTSTGRLVILPNFQRLFAEMSTLHHRDIAIVLNFQPLSSEGDISCYLAVGGRNGKFALATHKGIFVVSPDFDFSRLTAERPPGLGVSVCGLSQFSDENLLSSITCLQITHDAIYFTYKPSYANITRAVPAPPVAVGPFEPFGAELFAGMDDEDWEEGDWEDDDQLGMPPFEIDDDDPLQAIVHNWIPRRIFNTVFSVRF